MNVVRHDYEGMQYVVFEASGVVRDGFDDHGGKCFSRMDPCRRESPVAGQTVMETPGEKDRLVRLILVRKSSPIESHTRRVRRDLRFSHQRKGRPGGRSRTRASAPRSNPIHIAFESRTRLRPPAASPKAKPAIIAS
jgi:hypothetical protein